MQRNTTTWTRRLLNRRAARRAAVLGALAGSILGVSGEAAAASECHVNNTADDDNIANTLRWCVAKLNVGTYDSIVFDNSSTYKIDYTYVCPQTVSPYATGARFALYDQIDNPRGALLTKIGAVE